MNKKQISLIVITVITTLSALGISSYSLANDNNANLERRIERIESQVIENGKNIARVLGYLDGSK